MGLIKIINLFDIYNKHQFDISVEDQYKFMNSIASPRNDYERSYAQFRCQRFFYAWWVDILWFVISFFSIPILLILLYIKGKHVSFLCQEKTIAENKGMDEILPEVLTQSFTINHDKWNAGMSLSYYDILYFFTNIFGFRHPFFMLKCLMQIASYNNRITKYRPERIIVHQEFSCCSSILTNYCNSRGVKHINVMHGEKLRYIRDSFFRYDECYVWDNHYVNLFIDQKAEPSQFRIAIPPSLKIDTSIHKNEKAFANYKYYLAINSEEEIKSIVSSLSFIKNEGKTVKFRAHPRYTDIKTLTKYVPVEDVEFPNEVSILDSISNLDYAIGSFTTVLLQAHMSGKNIILDDVTYKNRFDQLKEYGYILSTGHFMKLSSNQ